MKRAGEMGIFSPLPFTPNVPSAPSHTYSASASLLVFFFPRPPPLVNKTINVNTTIF